MTTLHIPPLGAELTLATDWTFELYLERRNSGLIEALKMISQYPKRKWGGGDLAPDWSANLHVPATLPAGTVLTVRRYYIRLGQAAFDSVTFSAKIGKKSHRFWVKLADANSIQLATNETERLLASPANAEHLERSIAQLKDRKIVLMENHE